MRIAQGAWPVIAIVAIVCAVPVAGAWLLWPPAGWVLAAPAVLVLGWAFWFFRDPQRTPPPGDDLVISPADGVVLRVDHAPVPPEVQSAMPDPNASLPRITLFLNIFNVHVNRVPVSGSIERVAYTPGKFLTASLEKASLENERSVVVMRDTKGRHLVFAQIAGMIAKRIVNRLHEGDSVTVGDRFGLIRFGSRAEVWLPKGTAIQVAVGQKMVGGETIMARLSDPTSVAEIKRPTVAASGAGVA